MKRYLALLILLLLPLTFLGCGDANPDAPPANKAHASTWISDHPESALATLNFDNCTRCHAGDLRGSGSAVSCYSCHAFNADTNFVIHPVSWTNAFAEHRGYATDNGSTTCAKCHGSNLQGSVAAPSCFSNSFDGLSCHAEGPGSAPHTLTGGAFLDSANHGHVAKADLTVCQACHAQTNLGVTRFNLGITNAEGTGCEAAACHDANLAHPADWSAPSHAAAGNIDGACTLCHGAALDGGSAEISCLECHGVSPASNPTGCSSCHNQPPDGASPVGNISPNRQGHHARTGHTSWISATPSQTCARCHDGAGTGTANHFDDTNPADVNFFHPDASDTMSAVSDGTNTTCNGSCHITEPYNLLYPHTNKTWY